MLVALISCVKSKREGRHPAKELYTSPLFRKMLAFAESRKPDLIYVLSAKYGLVPIEKEIDSYEQTLATMSKAERYLWANQVVTDLSKTCDIQRDQFLLLAGRIYGEHICSRLGGVEVPMRGLSMGRRLSWLNKQLNQEEGDC